MIVTLPRPPSPILTRELLYTAVTRAKQQVTLVAAEESLRGRDRTSGGQGLGARAEALAVSTVAYANSSARGFVGS